MIYLMCDNTEQLNIIFTKPLYFYRDLWYNVYKQ